MLNNLSILTTRDLRNVCSFQLTFRFHMLFLIFKVHIISIQQIEQFWCLETYKLLVPAQKQLAHPLFSSYSKEYIERRHGEPFKFLFLPKMGLLGSQAVLEKKVQFWIMSNFLAPFFQLFMGKNLFFFNFFYIAASALKSYLIKK